MFPQFLIVLILASHIHGYALDASITNSRLNHDEQDSLSSRIVGGVDAPPGIATYMIALVTGYGQMANLLCGGSIVSERHVLTAAHCIEPVIMLGGELLPSFRGIAGNPSWNSTEILVKFISFLMHERWNAATLKNDIGLLIMTDRIKLSDRVTVIGLNFNWIGANKKSFVAGWGTVGYMMQVPDKKQILNVTTVDGQQCVKWMRILGGPWMPLVDPEKEICTFHSIGYGMCHGDSGSALVDPKTRKQIGLVTWGRPCAEGVPDVHVRVSNFKDWLIENLRL